MRTVSNASEGWTFGIEKNEISQFLAKRGLTILQLYDAERLEEKYFSTRCVPHSFRVNGTHCLVLASVC